MTLSQLVRVPLLLLFVLLQCVAPLAHAHINDEHGEYDGQGVHIDMVDAPWLNDHGHESDSTHLSVDEHHSAVVSMQPEYRSGELTAAQPVYANIKCPTVLCKHIALRFVNLFQQSLPLPLYQHPPGQAPPA